MLPKPEKKGFLSESDFKKAPQPNQTGGGGTPAKSPSFLSEKDFSNPVKKNDGGIDYLKPSPTSSPSTALSDLEKSQETPQGTPQAVNTQVVTPAGVVAEKETPQSFLSKEIDNSLISFSGGDYPGWSWESTTETPSLVPLDEQKKQIKEGIMSNPQKLKSFVEQRVNQISESISNSNKKRKEQLDVIARDGGDYFSEGNVYELEGASIKDQSERLTMLRTNAAMLGAALVLPKYLENPDAFNPESLGRDIVKISSPDLDAKMKMIESGGRTLPGIQKTDMKRMGIDLMKSFLDNHQLPSEGEINEVNERISFLEKQVQADPKNDKSQIELSELQKSMKETNALLKMKNSIQQYESNFAEENFEYTWNVVKEKLGAHLHKNGDSGFWGYKTSKLEKYIDDPELGLTEAEKKVARGYGIPLESKLLGTDIPGSGLGRSFKNALEQSSVGIGNTVSHKFGIRSEADQAYDLLNAESATRYQPPGESQRAKAALAQINEKEKNGEKLTPKEIQQRADIQKYVDVRNGWSKARDLTGNMTGQVLSIALVTRGLGAAGGALSRLGASAGTNIVGLSVGAAGTALKSELGGLFLSSYLMAKDNYDMQAIDLMPEEGRGAEREAYSNLMSGFEGATELIFRDTKILPTFLKGISPTVARATTQYINGQMSRQLAKDEINGWIKNYVKKAGPEFAKSITQNATEEAAIDVLQGITNSGFGIEDFDLYKTGSQALETFGSTVVGSGIIGAMAGHRAWQRSNANNKFTKATMMDMAANPSKYLAAVEQLQTENLITQEEANDKISVIKSANQKLRELPKTRTVTIEVGDSKTKVEKEVPFDYPEVSAYVLHRLNEDKLSEELKNTSDPIDQGRINKEISDSRKIRQWIYDGTIGVTTDFDPVTNSPEIAADLGIRTVEETPEEKLIGTPFSKISVIRPSEVGSPNVIPVTPEVEETKSQPENKTLLSTFKDKKRQEQQDFDKEASNKGVSVVRPSQVSSPQVVEKVKSESIPIEPSVNVSIINPSDNKAPEIVNKVLQEVVEMSQVIEEQAAENGFKTKEEAKSFFQNELGEYYNEDLFNEAFDVYDRKPKSEKTVQENAAPNGTSVTNVDELISNGHARIRVERNGKEVEFDKFDVVVDADSNTAEVGYVQKKNRNEDKGAGYEAYIDLGSQLLSRGITLESAQGGKMTGGLQVWNKLVKNGYAKYDTSAKKYVFTGQQSKEDSNKQGKVDVQVDPSGAATVYEETAARLEENGDTEGAKSLRERAKELKGKTTNPKDSDKQDTSEKKKDTTSEKKSEKPQEKPAEKKKLKTVEEVESEIDDLKEKEKTKPTKKKQLKTVEDVEAELDELFGKSFDRMSPVKVGDDTMTVEEYLSKAEAVLKQLYPDATITVYDNEIDYYKKEGRPVGSMGVFHPKEKRLAINIPLIKKHGQENTVFHEVIHPIVDEAITSKDGVLNDVWDSLMELKDVPGMKAVFDHVQAYYGRGAAIQKIEGITEFLTLVADGKIDLSNQKPSVVTKVIDLINKIFEALGISTKISTASDLVRLAESIKTAFDTSDVSALSNTLGRRTSANQNESLDSISQEEQDEAIQSIIDRAEGIPVDKLKAAIKNKTGWSDEKVNSFFPPKSSGISHARTDEMSEKLGLPEREATTPQSFDEWQKEASRLIKDGYNVADLIIRMETGSYPTPTENAIIAEVIANLAQKIESSAKPSISDIEMLYRIKKVSDSIGGSEVARTFVSRKMIRLHDNSLAGFLFEERESAEGRKLTDEEIDKSTTEYQEMKDVQLVLEEKIAELEAELNLEREKQKNKKQSDKQQQDKSSKKTKEDFVKERKSIIDSIREKIRKSGGIAMSTPVPYVKELIEISPDVFKLMRSFIEEGVSNLSDIVSKIHTELKGSADFVTEKDIHDIIAGDYSSKEYTKSELENKVSDLRKQAELENRLTKLLNDEPIDKKEKRERERSPEVQALQEKVEDLQEQRRLRDKLFDIVNGVPSTRTSTKKKWSEDVEKLRKAIERLSKRPLTDSEQLEQIKSRTRAAIKAVQAELDSGNYQEPVDKTPKIKKLDKEARDLKDELIALRTERNVRLAKKRYDERAQARKAADMLAEVLNVPRTIKSSLDFSAVLRQAVIPTISHPALASRAAVEMFKQSVSQKRFDRWFYELKEDPAYEAMKDAGLYIADPNDPRLSAKEERFMNNWVERIPFFGGETNLFGLVGKVTGGRLNKIGGLVKGSERAYVGYLNKMRVDLFKMYAENLPLEDRNADTYAGIASWVNNATGRGGLSVMEGAAPILNGVFFSPRLAASRLNILGLSDLAFAVKGQKGFYGKLTPPVRKMARYDLLKFYGTVIATLALFKMWEDDDKEEGLTVEHDPRSSDFGKIRYKDTRWDIMGGFQQYIRAIAQLLLQGTKSAKSGEIKPLTDIFGDNQSKDVVFRMVRSKLAPVPASGVNLFFGENMLGEKTNVGKEAYRLFEPLSIKDIYGAWEEGVGVGTAVTLNAPWGIGVQIQKPFGYDGLNMESPGYKALHKKGVNLSQPEQKDMTKEQYNEFIPKRQEIFEGYWNNIVTHGLLLKEDGYPTLNPNDARGVKLFSEMTHQEISEVLKLVGSASTRKAKADIGYKKEKEERNQDKIGGRQDLIDRGIINR